MSNLCHPPRIPTQNGSFPSPPNLYFPGRAGVYKSMPFSVQEPVDLVIRAIRELSTAAKVVAFYPPQHPAVRVAVDRVLSTIGGLLNHSPEVELAFGEAGILHQGEYLPDPDPALKAFASFLLNRCVARLTLRRGLDATTLTEFLRLLGSDPRQLAAQGGLARQFAQKNSTTIAIAEIDLEKILASEAEPVPGDSLAGSPESGIWKRLVTTYLRDPRNSSPAGMRALLRSLATDPARLSEWMEDAGGSAGKELSKLVGRLTEEIHKEAPDCQDGFPTRLGEALLLIPAKLRMDLVVQKIPLPDGSGDLMDRVAVSLGDAAIVDLISSFVESEQQLSPRLFSVCAKVFATRGKSAPYFGGITARLAERGGEESDLGRIWQSLQGLLVETDQDYLSENYKATLEAISDYGTQADRELREILSGCEGFSTAFLPDAVSEHACRVMMAALDVEIDARRVEELRDDLERRARRMAGRERMALLADTVRAISKPRGDDLRGPGRGAMDKRVRSVAEQMVRIFRSDFDHLTEDERGLAGAEFKELGGIAAPALADALAEEENWEVRKGLIAVLTSMGRTAMPVLLQRLDDPSWFMVRNVVMLLGEIGGQSLVEPLAGLLKHSEPQVRREAASALGKIGGSRAVAQLRQAILDPEVSTIAARVLGELDRENTVALFAKRLAKTGRLVPDERGAREAITILGEMEATEAVPALSRVLRRGLWIPISAGDTLRTQAAMALRRIGTPEALEAIEHGTHSIRRVVRDTCLSLSRQAPALGDPESPSSSQAAA
jgi:HEAT repeat protein